MFKRAARRFLQAVKATRRPNWRDYTTKYSDVTKEEFVAKLRQMEHEFWQKPTDDGLGYWIVPR